MCCAIQDGATALHYAAYDGQMTIVQYLVEKCEAVIATQAHDDTTPISDAQSRGHAKIADYLKGKVLKMIMGIEFNMLPFYRGVRGIIVKYLH